MHNFASLRVRTAALPVLMVGLVACSSDETSTLDGSAADGSSLPVDATGDLGLPDAVADAGVDSGPDVPLTPCVSNEACRGGYVCLEGFCREACSETDPCRGELTTCDVQSGYCGVCASDADCTNGRQCDTGLCDGGCVTDSACGAGSVCDDGSCTPQVCTPGEQVCDGDNVLVCNARGTGSSSTSCADACDDTGAGCTCTAGRCSARACVPGSGRCVASGGQVCRPDGSGYGALVECGADEFCLAGECLATDCTPGTTRCANTTVVRCAGGEFEVVEDCAASGSTCDDADGEAACQRTATVRCDNVLATCAVIGSGGFASDTVLATPLDTLDCEVSNGNDPTHANTTYRWDVVSQPEGSFTSFDSANEPQATVFIDLSGEYLLQVTAVDDATDTLCQSSVQVSASYSDTLSIQLTWDTPGDDTPGDEGIASGSDLDVHYLNRSLGCWTQTPADCHWRNKQPDWPLVGTPTDDPSIDIDDVNGSGPESASHNNPTAGTYSVGVNYYDAHGFGDSTATLNLYLFGSIVLSESRVLTQGEFWHVADVSFPEGNVTFVDNVFGNISDVRCMAP